MSIIAKISSYFEHTVVTLKVRKEYLNTVTYNTSVLLWIKNEQFDKKNSILCQHNTGVTNCQNLTVRFFGPP